MATLVSLRAKSINGKLAKDQDNDYLDMIAPSHFIRKINGDRNIEINSLNKLGIGVNSDIVSETDIVSYNKLSETLTVTVVRRDNSYREPGVLVLPLSSIVYIAGYTSGTEVIFLSQKENSISVSTYGIEESIQDLIDQIVADGTGGGSGDNIYTVDGTILDDRTVDMDDKSLIFQSANNYLAFNQDPFEEGNQVAYLKYGDSVDLNDQQQSYLILGDNGTANPNIRIGVGGADGDLITAMIDISKNVGAGTTSLNIEAGDIGIRPSVNLVISNIPLDNDATILYAKNASGNTVELEKSSISGGGGSPAGSDTQVQYNNAGAFGADANFTRDSSGQTLIRAQDVGIQNGTVSVQTGLAAISATDETNYSFTRFRTTPILASGVYFDGISLQNGFNINSNGITLGNLSGGNNTKITIDDVNEQITISNLSAYDDDTAAGVGGLTAGMVYMTTGSGSAPLNAAGILMIKQ